MKISMMMILIALFLLTAQFAYGLDAAKEDNAEAQRWADEKFADNAEKVPFSFIYDGQKFKELMKSSWDNVTRTDEDGQKKITALWREPSGKLEVRAEGVIFNNLPVVEWVLKFRNPGSEDSQIVEDIQALDDLIPVSNNDPVLHYAKGGTCSVEDYRPMTRILNKGGETRLNPNGGRSSSDYMPFINIEQPDGKGVIICVGWSGEWSADITRSKEGDKISARCGMTKTHLKLHPGEEIRSPRMAMLFYESGGWKRGQNLLRSYLLAKHRPAPNGKPLEPTLLNGNWGGTSAADHLENITAITENNLPIDYYWIDAEWFGVGKWSQTAGDWTPKADLYPQGFKPISDALHASGRKLLLWFEPERVCEGTPWYEEHKKWLLDVPKGNRRYNWRTSQAEPNWVEWESSRNQIRENDRLFNLADPEARAFLTDFISNKITEYGLDCFRHDANIAPLEFWKAADAPDRQGATEIHWVEGLYEFWDALLERHPGLIIDNCASGGRRIDIESMSRATPFWRTDCPANQLFKQCHTYGVSFWTPLNATGAMNPMKDDAYGFRSNWTGSLVFELFGAGDTPQVKTETNIKQFEKGKAALDEYKSVSDCFLGDYYPLTEYSQAEDAWMAWQFHRADLRKGLVQVFRRQKSVCDSGKLELQGLEPSVEYEISNLDTHETFVKTGEELAKGFEVKLPDRPSTAAFAYHQK